LRTGRAGDCLQPFRSAGASWKALLIQNRIDASKCAFDAHKQVIESCSRGVHLCTQQSPARLRRSMQSLSRRNRFWYSRLPHLRELLVLSVMTCLADWRTSRSAARRCYRVRCTEWLGCNLPHDGSRRSVRPRTAQAREIRSIEPSLAIGSFARIRSRKPVRRSSLSDIAYPGAGA
jgi:hypothetical protein